MLKIKKEYTFWKHVTILSPTEDGKTEQSIIKVQFKYDAKQQAIMAKGYKDADAGMYDELGLNAFKSVIIGWDGIADEDGNAIIFNQEMLEEVLHLPWIASAISKNLGKSIIS